MMWSLTSQEMIFAFAALFSLAALCARILAVRIARSANAGGELPELDIFPATTPAGIARDLDVIYRNCGITTHHGVACVVYLLSLFMSGALLVVYVLLSTQAT